MSVVTCWGNMRTAAHLQQLQGVAVVGDQHLQGRVVHWRIINLDGGQGLGVDKHNCQCRHKVSLRGETQDDLTRISYNAFIFNK